jgi:hypothetical protein
MYRAVASDDPQQRVAHLFEYLNSDEFLLDALHGAPQEMRAVLRRYHYRPEWMTETEQVRALRAIEGHERTAPM